MQNLVTLILALLIMMWGFSIMLRPIFGDGSRSSGRGGFGAHGDGFMGRLFIALIFSVIVPAMWWMLALVGRAYHRTFVVFTEFLTGVHDWGTYRTSTLKYGGACFAFLTFNGALLMCLSVFAVGSAQGLSAIGWLTALTCTTGFGAVARMLMRRMP